MDKWALRIFITEVKFPDVTVKSNISDDEYAKLKKQYVMEGLSSPSYPIFKAFIILFVLVAICDCILTIAHGEFLDIFYVIFVFFKAMFSGG